MARARSDMESQGLEFNNLAKIAADGIRQFCAPDQLVYELIYDPRK